MKDSMAILGQEQKGDIEKEGEEKESKRDVGICYFLDRKPAGKKRDRLSFIVLQRKKKKKRGGKKNSTWLYHLEALSQGELQRHQWAPVYDVLSVKSVKREGKKGN